VETITLLIQKIFQKVIKNPSLKLTYSLGYSIIIKKGDFCMANDKKSSLYDDQSSEEAASELDEYGVWVKSDPAKISPSESEDSDFPIPNDEVLSDFEIGKHEDISDDEMGVLLAEGIDDLDKELIPEDLENSTVDLESISFDNILDHELDDIEELHVEDILEADPDFNREKQIITDVPTIDALSFDNETKESDEPVLEGLTVDGVVSGENVAENGETSVDPNDKTPQSDADGENTAISEEVTVDTKEAPERETTELFMEDFLDDSPFDDDEIFGDEEALVPESGEVASPSVTSVEPAETESAHAEIEDAVDDTAKETEPESITPETVPNVDPAPAEIENATGDTAKETEPEPITPETVPNVESAPAEIEDAVDDTAKETEHESITPEIVPNVEPPPAEIEDAVGVTAKETEPEIVQQKSSAQPITETNLSTDILLRIAEELSSIRQELSTLKQAFLTIHDRESSASIPAPIENMPETEKKESVSQGGFFDDSDDEKIALTGNELDNILMSADFTEEAGVDISEDALEGVSEIAKTESTAEKVEVSQSGFFDDSDDEKIALTGNELDNVLMSADFTEETGVDISEIAPEILEKSVEDVFVEIDEVILDPSKDSEELQLLREEGVEPITPAPEDSSYLEADPIVQQESELEDIDLSDVVIDEPDLSGQLQENPLQEPVLEAITFDDMPLNLSDEDISADIETVVQENGEEYPLLEIPAEMSIEVLPEVEATTSLEEKSPVELTETSSVPVKEAAIPAKAAFEAEPTKLDTIPPTIQQELKTVLAYMDQLLEALPEEKIEEFAASKYFDTYKKLFSELGLV
jgi:hypothetical protein